MISVIAAKTFIIMFISFVYFKILCPLHEGDKNKKIFCILSAIYYAFIFIFYAFGVGYTIYMEV
jgi:hypothetical protein